MRSCSNPLLEWLVIGIVVAILAALITPCIHPPGGCGQGNRCANNLRQLYQLSVIYASQNHGEWPDTAKDDLLATFTRPRPPLIPEEEMEMLLCPMRGEPEIGTCDYRSPKVPWKSLAANDPVLADKPDNHAPGKAINVVLKDGSVVEAKPGEPLWKLCEEKLGP